ncbi:hypothetical protein D3C87_1654550 [compost metagenome]
MRDAPGQFQVDVGEDLIHLACADVLTLDLAQLKAVSGNDVLLLVLAHAVKEQPRLGEVVAEGLAALANLVRIDALRMGLEATILCGGRGFFRPAAVNGVWLVRGTALVDGGAV